MSRRDDVLDRWFKKEIEECERNLVVGTKVWRPGWDKLEEGVVIRVDRVRVTEAGDPVTDENGDRRYFVAEFKDHDRYESQTYRWKFFDTERAAWARFAELAERRLDNAKREVEKWTSVLEHAKKKAK